MRPVFVVALGLVVGCGRPPASEPNRTVSTSASAPTPRSAPVPAPPGLYTDDEIRKLSKVDIKGEAGAFGVGMFDIPALDVVPNGESRPRGEVFKTLGIDDTRVRGFWTSGLNFVVFLNWQVSPSYDISCMTATNDPDNEGLEMTDPKRKVYGIRLMKHPKSQ